MIARTVIIQSFFALSLLTQVILGGGVAQAGNTLLGTGAGVSLTTGDDNTLLGTSAGGQISSGNFNTMVGAFAGTFTTGSSNTFLGYFAGNNNQTGLRNTYLGMNAGSGNEFGNGNILIGYNAGLFESGSNKLYIASSDASFPLIYGEFNTAFPVGNNALVGINGALGVGTQIPMDKLHVNNGNLRIEQAGATHAILNFVANGKTWEIKNNQATGRLTFFSPGGGAATASFKFDRQAVENLFRVGVLAANTVDINGNLVVTGTITPDYVFTPEYHLETIEAHAAYMWEHRHLPAVGPGQVNAQGQGMVNVGQRSQGMLEELEKAHIYIEQLKSESDHKGKQISALTTEVTALKANENQLAQAHTKIDQLQGEVTALKALVHQLMSQNRDMDPGEEG